MIAHSSEVKIATDSDGSHTLLRNGQPYLARGANWPTKETFPALVAAGGNSIRTYASEIEWMLPLAREHHLTILVGIHIGRERQGFDYRDAAAVARQREEVLNFVRRYKNDREVLAWAIGNEPEHNATHLVPLWQEVNHLASLIKQEDPHHPVITVVAGFDKKKIALLIEHCPYIDALGVNWYGSAHRWPDELRWFGWRKPYFLTEFGPLGYWKAPQNPKPTEWGAPVEQTSTEKARLYAENWRDAVERRKGQSLGAYAFIWSTKQERTHTWFSMFLPTGERFAAVDALEEAWRGKPVPHPAPEIVEFKPMQPVDSVRPGQEIALKFHWKCRQTAKISVDVRTETTATQTGGDTEPVPTTLTEVVWRETTEGLLVQAPAKPGAYRVFVYVKTTDSPTPSAASANLPIFVVSRS